MFALETSNPALKNEDAFSQFYGKEMFASKPDVTTLQGVVNKTAILVGVAIASGSIGYALLPSTPSILWMSSIAAFVICIGLGFLLAGRPQLSPIFAPIYAIVEGLFLGSLTAALDQYLTSMQLNMAGGLALQALIITGSAVAAMLALYSTGILKPTRLFRSIVVTATFAVMIIYGLAFLLMILGGPRLPFIDITSAFDQGWAPIIGLALNVLILGLACLWLIIDFGTVEQNVKAGAPKYMEWYCGFALLVTLAWIYYEAVKLAFRLAVLFGSRD
jgi:uncharacterized YccA/Bax inhibitor family protein